MTGLPELGSIVRVWPMPGRRVQDGPRPVDRMGGGNWLPKAGKLVEWSTFHIEQMRGGDLLLHPPPCEGHDHAEDGKGECCHCGRDPKSAQEYDANRAIGIEAARAAAAVQEEERPTQPPQPAVLTPPAPPSALPSPQPASPPPGDSSEK